jgi:1-acyl-sn-glycerol-3-phosphate acyltransferase
MGDLFYDTVVLLGRHPFWVSSRPTVLHADRVPRQGAVILAANHVSPYDVPVLMRHTPRRLDFVSITEVFRIPAAAWFYSHMNAFPLDRGKSDGKAVRVILERLARGRVVAMFPQGRIFPEQDALATPGQSAAPPRIPSAPQLESLARVASLANVPIVPAIVRGTGAYAHLASWLPLRSTHYGVIYGRPVDVAAQAAPQRTLADSYRSLHAELSTAMERRAQWGLRATYSENIPSSQRCATRSNPAVARAAVTVSAGTHASMVSQ